MTAPSHANQGSREPSARAPEEATLTPARLGLRARHEPLMIEAVGVARRTLRLTHPFITRGGRTETLERIYPLLRLRNAAGAHLTGIGECPPLATPWYDGECAGTVTVALRHIARSLRADPTPITGVDSFIARYGWIVGHAMARVGVEGAYWDAIARHAGVPVWSLWGGQRDRVAAGISLGLEPTPTALLRKVRVAVEEQGLTRVKMKIAPGHDLAFVAAVRRAYPCLQLQVDANSAYDLFDPHHLRALAALDAYDLLMIEQPGPADDLLDHARQLAHLRTPICLDESIRHARHARQAIDCWRRDADPSQLVLNVKPPRVGGFLEAIRIAQLASRHGVPVWCGGMLESGLGKLANLHFSSRAEVSLPGDHVALGPYFTDDPIAPLPCHMGEIALPTDPGWGVDPNVLFNLCEMTWEP